MTKLVLEKIDAQHAFGTFGNVLLGVFRSHIPHASVLRQIEMQQKMLEGEGTLGLLNVIESGCDRIETRTRDAISIWSKGAPFGRVRTANVIEEDGMGGSMLRMVLRALGLTVPQQTRAMIFQTPPEAVNWIIREADVPSDVTAQAMLNAIASMRSGIREKMSA